MSDAEGIIDAPTDTGVSCSFREGSETGASGAGKAFLNEWRMRRGVAGRGYGHNGVFIVNGMHKRIWGITTAAGWLAIMSDDFDTRASTHFWGFFF